MRDTNHHHVVIIGAGPAGLGVAAGLTRLGVTPSVVDRHEVGRRSDGGRRAPVC